MKTGEDDACGHDREPDECAGPAEQGGDERQTPRKEPFRVEKGETHGKGVAYVLLPFHALPLFEPISRSSSVSEGASV